MLGNIDDRHIKDAIEKARWVNHADSYTPSWFEGIWAGVEQGFIDPTSLGSLYRIGTLKLNDYPPHLRYMGLPEESMEELEQKNPIMDRAGFDAVTYEGYTSKDFNIEFEDGHRMDYWMSRFDLAYNRMINEQIMSKRGYGFWSKLGTGAIAQLADPINYIGLPIGLASKARFLNPLAKKALIGGGGAAASNLAVDITLVKPAYEMEDIDYKWSDVVINTGVGALIGAGVGAGTHGFQVAMSKARAKTVIDIAADRPVDVRGILDEPLNKIDTLQAQTDAIQADVPVPSKIEFMQRTDDALLTDILDRYELILGKKGILYKPGQLFEAINKNFDEIVPEIREAYYKSAYKLDTATVDDLMKLNKTTFDKIMIALDDVDYTRAKVTKGLKPAEKARIMSRLEGKFKDYLIAVRNTAVAKQGVEETGPSKVVLDAWEAQRIEEARPTTTEPIPPREGTYYDSKETKPGLYEQKKAFNDEMEQQMVDVKKQYENNPSPEVDEQITRIDKHYESKAELVKITMNYIRNNVNAKQAEDEIINTFANKYSIYLAQDLSEIVDNVYKMASSYGVDQAEKEILESLRSNHLKEISDPLRTKVSVDRLMERIRAFADAHPDRSMGEGFEAVMGGSGRPIERAMENVDAGVKGKKAEYLGGIYGELQEAGVYKLLRKGGKELDLNTAREMYHIKDDGKASGITKDADAMKIAEVLHKYEKRMVAELNESGASIRWLKGYITRQIHIPKKMRAGAKYKDISNKTSKYVDNMNAWRQEFYERVDLNKTLNDPTLTSEKIDAALEDMYLRMITGKHMVGERSILSEKLSKSREIHFKTPEDWYAYDQKYGPGNLFKSIIVGFERNCENLILMRTFGPDPEASFNKIMNKLELEAPKDINLEKDLTGKITNAFGFFGGVTKRNLKALFDELTGASHMIEKEPLAWWDRRLRMWVNMANLGSSLVSSLADSPVMIMHAERMGIPVHRTIHQIFVKDLLGPLAGESAVVRKEVMKKIGIGIEGMLSHVIDRYGGVERIAEKGFVPTLHNTFFKMTLLQTWTDAHKVGWGQILSNHFADLLSKTWDELGRSRKYRGFVEEITKYGFNKRDWAALQKADTQIIGKNKFLFPDGIKDVRLAEKYRMFLVDSADTAILTPGAKERATLNMGFKPGTIEGTAARMFWQFKSFPLTLWNKVYSNMIKRGQPGGRGVTGLIKNAAHNIVPLSVTAMIMTIFGGLVTVIQDFIKGREPRLGPAFREVAKGSDMDLGIVANGLGLCIIQGGSLGLLGDLWMGIGTEHGGKGAESLFGPVFGQMAYPAASLIKDTVNGDFNSSKLIWLTKNNTPFQNYFLTRGVTDLYLWDGVLEYTNPGYLSKMERRQRKKYGTGYLEWGPFDDPTDIYYGGSK